MAANVPKSKVPEKVQKDRRLARKYKNGGAVKGWSWQGKFKDS